MTHWKPLLKSAASRSLVRAARPPIAGRGKRRLEIESLEDRLAPAIIGPPSQTFVNQVYQDLLGRAADPGGLAFWSAMVDQGISRPQVVAQIQSSVEYHTVEIERLYNRILGRAADPIGLRNDLDF